MFLLAFCAGCISEPPALDTPYLRNLALYSDQEAHRFQPLMTRYNLDPPLDEGLSGAGDGEVELFKPHHKFAKMRYLGDDGTVSIHYYLEAGTGGLIATLLVAQVPGLVRVGDNTWTLGPNQVSVYPNFVMDQRRTAGVGITPFSKYGTKPGPACDLLVVKASSDKLLEAEEYIARVLTEIPQVEIKVRIVEVSLKDTFEYGVDNLIYKESTGKPFLNTIFKKDEEGNFLRDENGNLIYESGGWTTKFDPESIVIGGQEAFRGSIFHVGGVHDKLTLDAFLEVMQRISDAQVLSAPKITVLNGHKAVIETGTDVPVQRVLTKTTETTFQYEYLSTGVKLVILPTVLMDDTLKVEVNGEVSSISGEESIETTQGPVSFPRFTTRSISDVVTVKDGEAFAMGGLLANTEIQRVSKVPLLGDIPILGYLFKSKSRDLRKTQVIFYVEPHIVRPEEESTYMPD